jgi:hypothetical protein
MINRAYPGGLADLLEYDPAGADTLAVDGKSVRGSRHQETPAQGPGKVVDHAARSRWMGRSMSRGWCRRAAAMLWCPSRRSGVMVLGVDMPVVGLGSSPRCPVARRHFPPGHAACEGAFCHNFRAAGVSGSVRKGRASG